MYHDKRYTNKCELNRKQLLMNLYIVALYTLGIDCVLYVRQIRANHMHAKVHFCV